MSLWFMSHTHVHKTSSSNFSATVSGSKLQHNVFSSFKALTSTIYSPKHCVTCYPVTLCQKCFHNSDLTIVATSYVMRCSNKGSGLVASAGNKYALHISFDVETKLRESPLFQKVSFSLLLLFFWLLCSAVTMTGHPRILRPRLREKNSKPFTYFIHAVFMHQ